MQQQQKDLKICEGLSQVESIYASSIGNFTSASKKSDVNDRKAACNQTAQDTFNAIALATQNYKDFFHLLDSMTQDEKDDVDGRNLSIAIQNDALAGAG